jgi:deoxyribonuclease V
MSLSHANKPFSIEKAHRAQVQLSKRVIFKDVLPDPIRYVAGVDVSYFGNLSIGAVTVLDYATLTQCEVQTATCETTFPYIPTLLSFRELPPAILCIRRLNKKPDVFLIDGHGYAHPYRCGLASHLGLVLSKPTIGVAKSKLIGELEEVSEDFSYLKEKDEIVGAAIKAKPKSRQVYVSVGHMISLETAVKIVKHCIRQSSIPEPIRIAHQAAAMEKRKIKNMG